jgi:hypothetical protein
MLPVKRVIPFPVRDVLPPHVTNFFLCWVESSGSGILAGWPNLAHDARFLGNDLVRDFTTVYFHLSGEIHRKPHSITFDRGHANHANWIGWIADDDFFTFSSCDDEHASDLLP